MLMIRKLALPALAVAALLLAPASAGARLPAEFVGISPQTASNAKDFELMEKAGVRSIRLPLYWHGVERFSPFLSPANWSGFDREVALAAEYGMRVFPFVWGSPRWVAGDIHLEPTRNSWGARSWASFLRRAVLRYGPRGSFWRENPDLPYLPIRAWELWNEPNIVTFAHSSNPERFARLIRAGGRAIHRANRGSKAILGGLFGRPLQIPPNVAAGDFLNRIYRTRRGIKKHFDGIALHPYVADAKAIGPQVRNLRRVMRKHRDGRTRIYLTELGWGSDSHQTRWERGLRGQARQLDRSFSMLVRNRRKWRVGGIWWFSWADIPAGGCQFCDSAGLLTEDRKAKPAWYSFSRWTGGDPSIVPRANLRD